MSEQYSNRLADLWQQGGRELAITFLRRALSVDNTLAEVIAALKFEGVSPHLAEIRLRDVFGGGMPPFAEDRHAAPQHQSTPVKHRRNRRTVEEMQQMRGLLRRFLTEEPGSLDTVQLVQMLCEAGHQVDTIVVNTLLKALEQEGQITTLGGKPKAWRTKSIPRQAALSPTIRRAGDHLV